MIHVPRRKRREMCAFGNVSKWRAWNCGSNQQLGICLCTAQHTNCNWIRKCSAFLLSWHGNSFCKQKGAHERTQQASRARPTHRLHRIGTAPPPLLPNHFPFGCRLRCRVVPPNTGAENGFSVASSTWSIRSAAWCRFDDDGGYRRAEAQQKFACPCFGGDTYRMYAFWSIARNKALCDKFIECRVCDITILMDRSLVHSPH